MTSFTFWGISLRGDQPSWVPVVTLYPRAGMFEYNASLLRPAGSHGAC